MMGYKGSFDPYSLMGGYGPKAARVNYFAPAKRVGPHDQMDPRLGRTTDGEINTMRRDMTMGRQPQTRSGAIGAARTAAQGKRERHPDSIEKAKPLKQSKKSRLEGREARLPMDF